MSATDSEMITFRVPEETTAPDVMSRLRARFAMDAAQEQVRRITYFDTFDTRLLRAGMVLSRGAEGTNGHLSLRTAVGRPIARCDTSDRPGFASDLPEGSLRDAIARKTSLRRLLPLVEVERRTRTVRVLDAEGKTVAFIRHETGSAGTPDSPNGRRGLPDVIRLLPVKGYGREFARVVDVLEEELGLSRLPNDELALAMEAAGRDRLADPTKVDIRLDPECSAEAAMRRIHDALLEVVLRNEPGTRARLDTEFLHDFRVTVRRIRAALGQVKGVFPEADRKRLAQEFAWLAGSTGPARDADVFLLKLPGYRAQLPDHSRADLAPLARFLERRRDAAYRELISALDSTRYRRLVEQWRAFLASPVPASASAPFAARPVGELASERIWSVAKAVLKKGRAIQEDTPADALHELRIRCKKLRYLLDFFRSLYDPDEMTCLIGALKKLQDNLGDFNDCEVQQDWLTGSAREMVAEGVTPVETFLAMGRLEDRLEIGQQKERRRFHRRFAAFADRDNHERLRRLFGPKAR